MAELEVEREVARILAELSDRSRDGSGTAARPLPPRADRLHPGPVPAGGRTIRRGAHVTASGETNLLAARHPLLVLSGAPWCPTTCVLAARSGCLILTGPNAGGRPWR